MTNIKKLKRIQTKLTRLHKKNSAMFNLLACREKKKQILQDYKSMRTK